MQFRLTSHAIDLMREQISKKPIASDELRRVEGLGNLFMSPTKFASDGEDFERGGWTYWPVYSLRIDGFIFYFYNGHPSDFYNGHPSDD